MEVGFPRAAAKTEDGSEGTEENAAKRRRIEGEGGAAVGTTPLAPGSRADSEAALQDKFGDELLSQKPLPEGGNAASREMRLCLTATQAADGTQKIHRVWLHNTAAKNAVVPAGAVIGRGGPGKFASLVTEKPDEFTKEFAWMFTRLTNF